MQEKANIVQLIVRLSIIIIPPFVIYSCPSEKNEPKLNPPSIYQTIEVDSIEGKVDEME